MSTASFIVPFSVQHDLPQSTVILLSRKTIPPIVHKILEYAYHPKPVIPPSLLTEIQTFDDGYVLLHTWERNRIERWIKEIPAPHMRSREWIVDNYMRITEGCKKGCWKVCI